MGTFIISMPIPIVVNSFARCYKNQVSRNEVSHRGLAMLNDNKRRNRLMSAKRKVVKSTLNTMNVPTFRESMRRRMSFKRNLKDNL